MKKLLQLFRISLISLFPLLTVAQNSIDVQIPEKLQAYSVHTLEIVIKKGAVSSFSKYQLDVPAQIIIREINGQGGNFSFDGKRAKYVWVECPKEDEFKVSFQMLVGDVKEKGVFEHRFYYIDGEVKKDISDAPMEVEFLAGTMNENYKKALENKLPAAGNIISNDPAPSKVPSTSTTNSVIVAKDIQPEKTNISVPISGTVNLSGSSQTLTSVSQPNSSNTTPVSLSENREYRVQIGSFGSKPNFSKYPNLGKLSVIEENGVFKLMVGSYYSKEEAVKKMEELKTKGHQGFIVSFVNGVKVK